MWSTILAIGGPIVGFFIRHWVGEKQWKNVRETANVILKDNSKTNDPKQAVTEALIQHNLDRIAIEANRVVGMFK